MDEDNWKDYMRSTFGGADYDGKKTELVTLHHLDSGGLSLIIDGTVTCYLDSEEWLRLLNCLLFQRKFRDWIDQRKEAKESKEIMGRLALFEQMGLQGRDLLRAAMLPETSSEEPR